MIGVRGTKERVESWAIKSHNPGNYMAIPISIPKPGLEGEGGMPLTDWRGDDGIRSLLRFPPPLEVGGLSRAGLTPVVLGLRLYTIPVPILDLGLTPEGEIGDGGGVDFDDGGGIEGLVEIFPSMPETGGGPLGREDCEAEEGCEYVRSRVVGGGDCTSVR